MHHLFKLGHTIERALAVGTSRGEIAVQIKLLQSWLAEFKDDEDPQYRRLATLPDKLTFDMSHKHFVGLMVPIERLFNRQVVDSDFVVSKGDHTGARKTYPLTIVLDNIRSALNIGSVFRTAECLGVENIMLCGYTATPENSKVAKAAMGTSEKVPFLWYPHLSNALEQLQKDDAHIIAVETCDGAGESFAVPTNFKRIALLFGNEHHGLDIAAIAAADQVVAIPMLGQKNSLNIAVSAGIAIHNVIQDNWRD